MAYRYWRTTEVKFLKENLDKPFFFIYTNLDRSERSIRKYMNRHGLRLTDKRKWTDKDFETIKLNCHKSSEEIAEIFGVTRSALSQFINYKKTTLTRLRLCQKNKCGGDTDTSQDPCKQKDTEYH